MLHVDRVNHCSHYDGPPSACWLLNATKNAKFGGSLSYLAKPLYPRVHIQDYLTYYDLKIKRSEAPLHTSIY